MDDRLVLVNLNRLGARMSFSPSRLYYIKCLWYASHKAKSNFSSIPLMYLYNTIVTPLKESNACRHIFGRKMAIVSIYLKANEGSRS